jgi:hypothetical protein
MAGSDCFGNLKGVAAFAGKKVVARSRRVVVTFVAIISTRDRCIQDVNVVVGSFLFSPTVYSILKSLRVKPTGDKEKVLVGRRVI